MRNMRLLTQLVIVALAGATAAAQSPPAVAETGLSGSVRGPDGQPLTTGTVVLRIASSRITADIGRDGRFRIVPSRDGFHELRVNAPGLSP